MPDNKRYLFTSLMGCTGTAIVNTPSGNIKIDNHKMTAFLVRNIDGFCSDWNKFIIEPSPRVHKLLERADICGDTHTMQMLLEGKRTLTGDIDEDQVAFLNFYITHAQICFNKICNASGCTKVGTKRCGKCQLAVYCSKECQIGDWRTTHKKSCSQLAKQ